jgi:hypothetical protein
MSGLRTSETSAALVAALVKAQRLIQPAVKDSVNPHLRNKYADLASVMGACLPHLSAHNLAVVQVPRVENGWCIVTTRLAHESGEWMENDLALPIAKQDAQGIGSAITYGRRYGLSAMVGVVQDDDDGNEASKSEARQESPPAVQRNAGKPASRASQRPASEQSAQVFREAALPEDQPPVEMVEAPMELVAELLDAIRHTQNGQQLALIWPKVTKAAKPYPGLLDDCVREKDKRKAELGIK